MKGRPNNALRIPTSLDGKFFKYWFEFLRPFHNLTNREIDVIASFVKQRYVLSKVISDPDILDRETMSETSKKKVREECNISSAHFQVIMGNLRKSRVIENGRINPKFLPNIVENENNLKLLLYFEFK